MLVKSLLQEKEGIIKSRLEKEEEKIEDKLFFKTKYGKLYCGDAYEILKQIPDESVNCIITSPPYHLQRNYEIDGQIGLESSLSEYIDKLLRITNELKRILRKDGVLFWNHGFSYATSGKLTGGITKNSFKYRKHQYRYATKEFVKKSIVPQNIILILKMTEQGWIWRDMIVWAKKIFDVNKHMTIGSAMPGSQTDRLNFSWEPIFMLVKSQKYYFDNDALKLPLSESTLKRSLRNIHKSKSDMEGFTYIKQREYLDKVKKRLKTTKIPPNVFFVTTKGLHEEHFAAFPEELILPLIKMATKKEDVVLDPFIGSGTTAVVAEKMRRKWIGIDLNPNYCKICKKRLFLFKLRLF